MSFLGLRSVQQVEAKMRWGPPVLALPPNEENGRMRQLQLRIGTCRQDVQEREVYDLHCLVACNQRQPAF